MSHSSIQTEIGDTEITRKPLKQEFVESLAVLPGVDGTRLAECLLTAPETAVRINRRKTDAVPYPGGERVPWCRDGWYLAERPVFTLNPLLHAGAFYVQDPSSMIQQEVTARLAERLRRGAEPLRVLDLCAAPGGKTTAIINALQDGDLVVANEYVPARASVLRENIAKWGYPSAAVTNSPASAFAAAGPLFDIVAVDAPCSGEGMMRKDETARTQWSPGLVAQCAGLQREIVADAAAALRPGGYLVYSTCTFNRSENEDNVAWMTRELGLEPVDLALPPDWGIAPGCCPDLPALRFMPHVTRGEGLFLAVLQKPGDHDSQLPVTAIDKRQGKKKGKDSKNTPPSIGPDWLRDQSVYAPVSDGRSLRMVPLPLKQLLDSLPGVKVLTAGVETAELKGRDWAPLTQLALSTAFNPRAFTIVELDEAQALSYLRHEPLTLPEGTPRGYVCVAFEGRPLGFVKNIGNRANNLYPSQWKIRNL